MCSCVRKSTQDGNILSLLGAREGRTKGFLKACAVANCIRQNYISDFKGLHYLAPAMGKGSLFHAGDM